jgi:hypothetical protein
VRQLRQRPLIVVSASVLAFVLLLFPPWRARAIRTTTRYAGIAGVTPSTMVDTISWPLSFVALYPAPRASLPGERMRELVARSLKGDAASRDSLREATRALERRYKVPEVLRMDGELWRDSVLMAAGIPSLASYDLTFTLDQKWIVARLAALALIAYIVDFRSRRNLMRQRARDRPH